MLKYQVYALDGGKKRSTWWGLDHRRFQHRGPLQILNFILCASYVQSPLDDLVVMTEHWLAHRP